MSLPPVVFAPASREMGVPLLIVYAGASGTGKTRSALRTAEGITGDIKKVALLDTENKRGLHHIEAFEEPFLYAELRPPFTPERFGEGMRNAINRGAEVLVIDSFSDEMEGEGGLSDIAETSGTAGAGGWKDAKARHKRFIREARLAGITLILCLRAEERIAIEPDPERPKKTRVVQRGWVPICEKRLIYDAGIFLTFAPDTAGMPRFDMPNKVPDFARPFFPVGKLITQDAGRALKRWAMGASARDAATEAPRPAREAPARQRGREAEEGARRPPEGEGEAAPEDRGGQGAPPPDAGAGPENQAPAEQAGAALQDAAQKPDPAAAAEAEAREARTLQVASDLIARFDATQGKRDHLAIVDQKLARQQMDWLKQKRPELAASVETAKRNSWARAEAAEKAARSAQEQGASA